MAVRDVVQAAAGVGGGDNLYVEDVFSTYLYTGAGASTNVPNGINLADNGGLVWFKSRSSAQNNWLIDSARGTNFGISTNTADAQAAGFGFTFNSDGYTGLGSTGFSLVSWTFRKAPKFFDVVTYTGNGVSGRQISHSLGTQPGFIMVKRTDTSNDYWRTAHINGSTVTSMSLNDASGASSTPWSLWSDSSTTTSAYAAAQQTDAHFTVGSHASINGSGGSFVAYLFASNAGGFGESGEDSVISCGSYTGAYPSTVNLDIGFEPQWILIKNASRSSDWGIFDVMRELPVNGDCGTLAANSVAAENGVLGNAQLGALRANGFTINSGLTAANVAGDTHIYIAIRRGPMKTPESGTEVFEPFETTNSTSAQVIGSLSQPDMFLSKRTDGAQTWRLIDRLRSGRMLRTDDTDTESGASNFLEWDVQSGVQVTVQGAPYVTNDLQAHWMFRRAPGFFDVVAYTGTGANRTVAHNLTVAPEMMIVKNRVDANEHWQAYHAALGATHPIILSLGNAAYDSATEWNDTEPTSTVFTVGTQKRTNFPGSTYIAYLFATLPGISKVGSYTGNGTSQTIDCGFSAGARFVMVKRSSNSGSWLVFDTVRGIVAGNDPYLQLNSSDAEVTNTDRVDPAASGFTVNFIAGSDVDTNVNGDTYIFLAIA